MKTTSGDSHIPIDRQSFNEHIQRAKALLGNVKWKPGKKFEPKPVRSSVVSNWSSSPMLDQPEQSLSLIQIFKDIGKDDTLFGEDGNHILHVIRDGICFGLTLAKLFGQSAGLETLMQQNQRSGSLTGSQQTEFAEKQSTMAVIATFGFASYVVWNLGDYKPEELSSIQMEFPGVPELFLTNYIRANECTVFWYGFCLEKLGLVQTEIQAVKMTKLYFEALLAEIRNRVPSLKHTEFFTRVSYQLKGTDFVVKGFEEMGSRVIVGIEFNRVSFKDIVGNQSAKHNAKRLADRLVCYDVDACKNPFMELGGLPFVSMGFGTPGTGKSLQIAATATLIDERCKILGIPFLFWPLPENLISSYQGKSAEQMASWMERLKDKDKIVYATIDDAENNLRERTLQGTSEGVEGVIGVLLRGTEGASAIKRGSSTLQIFTNIPDRIDKAVLSRVQIRYPIDGAITPHDFYDQDVLWWTKYDNVDKGFVSMNPLTGYVSLSDQADMPSLSQIETGEPVLGDERMAELMHKVEKDHGRNDHGFFAHLFHSIKGAYPSFSSRDVRNIQTAIDARVMDFDLPEKWFDDLDIFFHQQYDRKVEMVKELMKKNMNGLSFADIRRRETIKYLSVFASITNVERERAIAERLKSLDVDAEARKRFLG